MATLVLGAVGTLVGGPIGGAIGATIGNQADRALFAPRGAKGARLASLGVQSSAYGTDLPRVFGTMRLAGSVIWATDLREDRHRGGGKGRARTTTYSYSASFAVALSARRVLRVGRIWADGNLLRGAGGDWKAELGAFRLHPGDEAQGPDPLIAAAEGIGAAPAYRGLAYAVFEDLQLGDYGNRIPSLSFEVVADEGAVTLAAIAGALSGGAVRGAGGPSLAGYAAAGDSVRGAIEGLAAALPVAFAGDGDGLALVDEAAAPLAIPAAALAKPPAIERRAAGTLNEAIAVAYADPARDGQAGTQRARRGAAARRTGTVQLPAAIDAGGARAIAEARLAREWAGRERATVTLPRDGFACAAGTIVTLPGHHGSWRVTARTIGQDGVAIEAVRLPGGGGSAVPAAAPGRQAAAPDLAHGPTRLAALDLPLGGGGGAPVLRIAAGGTSAGWRRATVIGSTDGGASWPVVGGTAPAAIMGVAVDALPPGGAMLVDEANHVDILLDDPDDALAGDDRLGWTADANLAVLGDELIQFGVAAALGGGRWRLSRLLRGRRGTEWAMADHAAGERFVLLDEATLLDWTLPESAVGGTVALAATGIGDARPAEAALRFEARGRLPPAPVALRARPLPGGGVALGWTRRSRDGWAWRDGGDAPLAEEAERYRVAIETAAGTVAVETAVPALDLPAGARAVAVAMIGTYGASRAARLILDGVSA